MKQANTAAAAVPKKKFSLSRALKRDWQLWVMILPAALYILIFCYGPMYGLQLAFKDFDFSKVLSRKTFRARKIIMKLFVFTMYFNGGMIPTYMLIKDVGLLNSPLVMIIYGAVNVYNLIITRTFFETSIPDELYEAATLDGCSHFRYFGTIVLPLSKAVIAVIMLYYLVGHWNDFFNALLYINSDAYQPLQIVLRNILLLNQAMAGTTGSTAGAGAGAYAQQYADQIKFGVIIVSTLPVLCVYPFIQKYFEKGVMIGAVKG